MGIGVYESTQISVTKKYGPTLISVTVTRGWGLLSLNFQKKALRSSCLAPYKSESVNKTSRWRLKQLFEEKDLRIWIRNYLKLKAGYIFQCLKTKDWVGIFGQNKTGVVSHQSCIVFRTQSVNIYAYCFNGVNACP